MADQPFRARRVHRLGVAPPPLPLPLLSTDALATAIVSCVTDPAYGARATAVARDVDAEDGAAAVLAHVDALAT